MNTFTPSTLTLSMETGCGPLSDAEAQKFAALLTHQLACVQPQDQRVILGLIKGLRELPKHEAAFGDIYKPLGYVPGWEPDP